MASLRKHIIIALVSAAALFVPQAARAQLDAIIDAVVDAVEPTPVYDTGLREATENLASKIDRLNHVLFGGSEETSATYRYMTMYSDLYELTTAFSGFVDRTYSNAVRLARFKKLFSDPNTTNAEVRAAAREAVAMLEREQEEVDRVLGRELAATEMAAGLIECSVLMDVSPPAYISEGKKTYGTSISEDGTSTTTGVLGTAVMVIIGLLTVVYTLFSGIHVMRGSANAESLLSKLLLFIVIAIVIILAIQSYI